MCGQIYIRHTQHVSAHMQPPEFLYLCIYLHILAPTRGSEVPVYEPELLSPFLPPRSYSHRSSVNTHLQGFMRY